MGQETVGQEDQPEQSYGAILNPGCRFFDMRIGQSVTLSGRCITKHMASKVNEIVAGKYDHKGESVVYGDTDSVYFSAYKVLEKEIKEGLIPWTKGFSSGLVRQDIRRS